MRSREQALCKGLSNAAQPLLFSQKKAVTHDTFQLWRLGTSVFNAGHKGKADGLRSSIGKLGATKPTSCSAIHVPNLLGKQIRDMIKQAAE
jgi:hypothetical protein